MNVLIDCGAHKGENWTWFLNRSGGKIFAFEPNPHLLNINSEIISVYKKAVSDHNGIEKFYIMESSFSSSLYRKKTGKVKEIIEVECIDLAEWIVENINEDDNVFLKLDIEGEEHKVLKHLFDKGLLGTYINEVYCEFHQKKLRE
jgi:FkbM family methyltransferase